MGKTSRNQRFLKAFTLTEVLVVIALIIIIVLGVLVASSPLAPEGGRAQARDVKRITELNNLRTALQLYFMEYGEYPTSTETEGWCSLEQTDPEADDYCVNLITVLSPYLAEMPGDPLYGREIEPPGKKYSYQYRSTSSGEEYKIHADLETRDSHEISSGGGYVIHYTPPSPPPSPLPDVYFSSPTYSVNENEGSVTITVDISVAPTDNPASVDYDTSDGSATGDAACGGNVDYISASGQLNWAIGDGSSKTFTVTICDDSTYEGDETVNLALSNPVNVNLGSPSSAVLTIVDDELPDVYFSSPTYSVNENEGSVTITVDISGPAPSDNASVQYDTSDGSAFAGTCGFDDPDQDYESSSGILKWAEGESGSKTFTVTICDDSTYEGDETVDLVLSNPQNVNLGSLSSAVLTIVDDEEPSVIPDVYFSSPTYSVDENGESVTITVDISGPAPSGNASVQYDTSDGSATAGTCGFGSIYDPDPDYESSSGILKWAEGESGSKTFTVTICDDSEIEGDETVNLILSNPQNVNLGSPSSAVLTIVDDEEEEWAISTSSAAFEFGPMLFYLAISQIDPTHYLIAYEGSYDKGWSTILEVDGSWNISTSSSAFEFDRSSGHSPAISKIDPSHYLVAYEGSFADGWSTILEVDGSWNISTSSSAFEFDPIYGYSPAISQIDSTHYLVAYRGPDDGGWSTILEVDGSWNISTSSSAFEFDPIYDWAPEISQIDSTHYLVAYRGPDSCGWAVVLEVTQ